MGPRRGTIMTPLNFGSSYMPLVLMPVDFYLYCMILLWDPRHFKCVGVDYGQSGQRCRFSCLRFKQSKYVAFYRFQGFPCNQPYKESKICVSITMILGGSSRPHSLSYIQRRGNATNLIWANAPPPVHTQLFCMQFNYHLNAAAGWKKCGLFSLKWKIWHVDERGSY